MAVLRVNKTRDYTVMSNHHLKDRRLSLKAKGLLSTMLSLPDTWDYSIAGLVAISKENETAVKSTLGELREYGYLVITKKLPNETNSGRIEYEYDIYEQPQEKQEIEKQGVENLPLEILPIENHGQLNTNISNTKELNTKDKKKERKKSSYDEILSSIENDGLRELYLEYIKMRKMIKAPMTDRALEMLIGKVNKLEPHSIKNQKKLLENAIMNNWKSVYPLKPDEKENARVFRGEQQFSDDDYEKLFDHDTPKVLPTEKEVEQFRKQIEIDYPDLEPRRYEMMVESYRKGEWE